MQRFWTMSTCTVFTLALLPWAPAWGKDCGGAVTCECGDIVIQDYKLPADLGPCSGNGLDIGDNVKVNGQGHHLVGPQLRDTFGVIFRGQGSSVKNVKVTKFARCVRFRGNDALARPASDNVMKDSELSDCGFFTGTPPRPATGSSYGVDFAEGAIGNTVKDNWIHDAFDEGVHFGSGSANNTLVNNLIENNVNEQVYILNTSGNVVKENVITGGRVAVFVDGEAQPTTGNDVKENLADRLLQVRGGGAADNEFKENTFRSIRFERNATNNLVKEGRIVDGAPCLQFRTGATGNVLQEVELVNCVSDVDARETGTNTLINVTPLHPDRIIVQNQAVVLVCNEEEEDDDENPASLDGCQQFTAPLP